MQNSPKGGHRRSWG